MRIYRALVVVYSCFFCAYVESSEISGLFRSELEYSNNIFEESSATEDDLIGRAGIDVEWVEESKSVEVDASLSIETEHYTNGSYSEETSLRSGFGLFQIDVIESFVDWRINFSREDVLGDSSVADSPNNREFRTVFRTGPSVYYYMSPASNVRLSSNYVNVENSDEDVADSKRADLLFRFSHNPNRLTGFFFSAWAEETLESDDLEVDTQRFSIGVSRLLATGELLLELGVQDLQSEDGRDEGSNYYNVVLSNEDVLGHSVHMSYQQDISDSSVGSFFDEGNGSDPLFDVISSNDIVTSQQYRVDIDKGLESLAYSLSLQLERDRFSRTKNTERRKLFRIRLFPSVGQHFRPKYEYEVSMADFGERSNLGEDLRQSHDLGFTYQFTREFSLDWSLNYETRDNDDSSDREYEELSSLLKLQWVLF